MAKGIKNMAGDTKCVSPLAIFCIPSHIVAAPLPYSVSPHTLCGDTLSGATPGSNSRPMSGYTGSWLQ